MLASRTESTSSETESDPFDRAVALIRRELRGVPITTAPRPDNVFRMPRREPDDGSTPAASRLG